MSVAHKIGEKPRTDDIVISEPVDFGGLLLSKNVLCGLQNAGFERPSPIQLKAIPLGRCGLDLIVQAKSGTGKTCVFSVIALESLQVQAPSTQVLVLAPTREVAIQIWEVIESLGSAIPGLRCHTFIGGMPVHEDRKKLQLCHIAVGTPGRIQSLIEAGWLKTESIRLYVLDEADKLLEDSFQETINWIYSALPENKQMLALSATYPESMAQHLTLYMRNPTFIRLNVSDPTLLGIKQYFACVPNHPLPNKVFDAKTAVVVNLLSSVTFHQCLIFSNMQTRAQNLENDLTSQGWPTACIAGSLDQKDRITAMAKLKSYQCRVLISTDLTSRGIDADKVNLVINLDVPRDHETYLHRIGRAGRFGSYGAAVTIVSEGQELLFLQALERKISTFIRPLPDPVPSDLVQHQLNVKLEDIVSTEQLFTLPKVTHLAMAKSGSGTEAQTALQNQPTAETGNLSQLDLQNSEGTEETGQDDFSALSVKNDVEDHHSCHKESGSTNLSQTQNDVPENDVLNSSVLPSEQEWHRSCTNGQIVAPGSYDLKNHSSAKGWMDADGQIASKKSDTENLEKDLVLEKKHEVAVGISQPVSAEIVRAENKEQVIVQEEIKVVLRETSGKCVAASSKQSDSMSDIVDSEIVSDINQTLSEGPVNQIRTSSCQEKAYLDKAEKEYRLGEACICETRSKHASGETCLGVAGIQQTSGEICLSRTKLDEKEKTCPGEGSMHSLKQRHFDKEDLERLEIGGKLVSSDQSHVCSFGSEATDQTLQRNMAIKGKEKMDASCDDKSIDKSRLDGSGIAADGGEVKCNKMLSSTGAEDETHHDKLVTSLPEVTGDAQNHEKINGDTSKNFVSYNETTPPHVASKVANKKSSKVSTAAKMWEETLSTDLSDQEKVKGNPSTLRVVKEQTIKGTSLGKGHAQENSRGLSENRHKQNSKISSGASAVAKLWGEMLGTDAGNNSDDNSKDAAASKCSERLGGKKSCVNSDDDEQCASLRDSENTKNNQVDNEKMTLRNQKEQRGRGKDVGEQRKSRKEQLSWESELALYVAARAKLNAADPDNKGEVKESVENSARPQKQARRRLGGGKIKTSPQENCEKAMPESSTDNTAVLLETAQSADNLEEKCEMDKTSVKDAENRTFENCYSKLPVRVSCVPNKAVVEDCTAGAVSEITREGRKEADKTHTTLEEGHQSRDKSDMKLDSAVAFKESDASEMSGSLASGAEEGTSSLDHAVDIQGHADISVGSILQKSFSQTRSDKGSWGPFYPSVATELSHILSRLSTPQTTRLIRDPHTYSSALQDYSRFLEQDPIAEPPSVLDLVNRTFKCSGGAVPAEDLSKISKFLDNFHRDIQCRVLSENPVLEESDRKISSSKEDLVDKAVQTEHSFLYLNGFEQEKDSEVLTFRSESRATIANSGKDSRVGINSSGHGAEIGLECRGALVTGPDKAQAAVLQRERQMMGLPVSSTSCIYGESPLASSGDGEQNFDLPPERPNLEQHGDRKHTSDKTAVESMVQNEKAPPTDAAIEKSSSAQRQGSNLLPARRRANRNESLKDRHKRSAEESSSDAVRKRNNLSTKVSSSDKPRVEQEDFQKSEVEESSFSSSNTSSFSSDNEETAAAEKSDDRSTVFYKNHYTHEPALPRGRTVPPKLKEAERGEPNKRHERQNVTGACSSEGEKRHRPFDFFKQHATPEQKALNSWHAWYSHMQSGYPYAPLQTGYQRSSGRPFSQMPASYNPPQVNFPHYDSTMHQSYYGPTPWPAGGYYLENKNCRCSQRPCNASSAAAQKPCALSVQSVWSTAMSQQEYIKWMTGFYRELARLELSSPRS